MKKSSRFLLMLLPLLWLLGSCSKPKTPVYTGWQNFRLEKAGLSNNVLAADVGLYNPNGYNLQLKSAELDVYFNNSFIGRSVLDTLIQLPGTDTAYVPIQLKVATKDLLKSSAQLLINPNVKIRVSGTARAGRSGFFVNVPINYEGTQRIQL